MHRLATALRHLALFLLAAIVAVCGVYFAWMATVLFFKLTGQLSEGVMFRDDLMTPGYAQACITLAICGAIIGLCILLRRRIKRGMAGTPAA